MAQGSAPLDTGAPVSTRQRSRRARFAVGNVLVRGFRAYRDNFLAFSALSALVYAPLFLLQLAWSQSYASMDSSDLGLRVLHSILQQGLPFLLQGALAYGVFQGLRGRPTQVGECVRGGLRSLFSVLTIALLVGLVAGGLQAIPLVAIASGSLVGVFLFIPTTIAAVMITCAYFVAVPAAVVEQAGPALALSRSAYLTRGQRWSIFSVLFLIGLLAGLATVSVRFIASGEWLGTVGYGEMVAAQVVSVLFAGWLASCAAAAYHDLRMLKEGVGLDELAAIFD